MHKVNIRKCLQWNYGMRLGVLKLCLTTSRHHVFVVVTTVRRQGKHQQQPDDMDMVVL